MSFYEFLLLLGHHEILRPVIDHLISVLDKLMKNSDPLHEIAKQVGCNGTCLAVNERR